MQDQGGVTKQTGATEESRRVKQAQAVGEPHTFPPATSLSICVVQAGGDHYLGVVLHQEASITGFHVRHRFRPSGEG